MAAGARFGPVLAVQGITTATGTSSAYGWSSTSAGFSCGSSIGWSLMAAGVRFGRVLAVQGYGLSAPAEMRDSISHEVAGMWQELGTSRIPPRPFLQGP